MTLEPESILNDRYRILHLLGQGGMGAVYLAYDATLEHQVAVKVNRNPNPLGAGQFLREAQLLAALRHPNLPRVTDYFVIGAEQYLVMDYIPGENLANLLETQRQFPLARVLDWAGQLGSALNYMHSQNPPVIHRDIKPANIKLTPEGEVILVDFGLAKSQGSDQPTASGAFGYTPGFAPPEQYGNAITGPYSDQYSLAATLYVLLTGQKPPDGLQRVLNQVALPPLRQFNPEIPFHVERAILRALSIRPDERFINVYEFNRSLADPNFQSSQGGVQATLKTPQVSAGISTAPTISSAGGLTERPTPPGGFAPPPLQPTVQSPPPPPPAAPLPFPGEEPARKSFPWIWLGVGIGLLIVFGLGYLALGLLKPTSPPDIAQVIQTATATGEISTTSPAIETPLLPTEMPQPTETVVPPTATSEPTALPSATVEPTLALAANGKMIAYSADTKEDSTLQIWTARLYQDAFSKFSLGDQTQLTTGPGDKIMPAWSPDGQKLLFVARGEKEAWGWDLFLLDLAEPGAQPRDITKRNGDEFLPAWSPDGKLIAFTAIRYDGVRQLYLMNADGSNLTRLSYDYDEGDSTFSPDMKWLLFIIRARGFEYLYQRPRTATDLYTTPMPYDSVELFGRQGLVSMPEFSRDGTFVAYTEMDGAINLINGEFYGEKMNIGKVEYASKGARSEVLTNTDRDYAPTWSPDGLWILFVSERRAASPDLFIMTSGGALQTNLTSSTTRERYPAWQP